MLENINPAQNDWRRQGQEKYLKGARLLFKDYQPYRTDWDHDHCEFCGSKISLNDEGFKKGYSTIDGYHWICIHCFNDFQNEFVWQVEE